MRQQLTRAALALLLGAAVAACSNTGNPVAPGGAAPGDMAAGPGGNTLKAGTPNVVFPTGEVTIDSITPILTFTNVQGTHQQANFQYEIELYRENDLVKRWVVGQGPGETTATDAGQQLEFSSLYRWRVRARFGDYFGLWSPTANFRTLNPPSGAPVPAGGGVGARRNISPEEALSIIIRYHDDIRANLGSGSTRESRVAFWFAANAIVHYGHPRWNPAGGDPGWCVKDAGGGRPPSDDVIVRCDSRDAWDTILGAGANGYHWHLEYLGRLPGGQNVYPPPPSSLPR